MAGSSSGFNLPWRIHCYGTRRLNPAGKRLRKFWLEPPEVSCQGSALRFPCAAKYTHNHFPPSRNLDGTLFRAADVREDVTLSLEYDKLTGRFRSDQYNTVGSQQMRVARTVQGDRITVNTTTTDVP